MDALTNRRASGILLHPTSLPLHPTSLPGKYGIGDFGREAFAFVDALAEGGQTLWQILPLGPIGYGESPYSPFSTFAGEDLLISLDGLAEWGLLDESDLNAAPTKPSGHSNVRCLKKRLTRF